MAARFTDGEYTIMTGAAVIHDACMIKSCRHKARSDMTFTAVTIGRYMVRRGRFASGGYTVVARLAVINDALVIKTCAGKGRSDMAHGAILRRRKVIL